MVVCSYGFESPSTVLIYIKGLRDKLIMVIMVVCLLWSRVSFNSIPVNSRRKQAKLPVLKLYLTAIFILVQYQDKSRHEPTNNCTWQSCKTEFKKTLNVRLSIIVELGKKIF